MTLDDYLSMSEQDLLAEARRPNVDADAVLLNSMIEHGVPGNAVIQANFDFSPFIRGRVSPMGLKGNAQAFGFALISLIPDLVDNALQGGTWGDFLEKQFAKLPAKVQTLWNNFEYRLNQMTDEKREAEAKQIYDQAIQLERRLRDQDPEIQRRILAEFDAEGTPAAPLVQSQHRIGPLGTDMRQFDGPTATTHAAQVAATNPLLSNEAKAFYAEHPALAVAPTMGTLTRLPQGDLDAHIGVDLTQAIGVTPEQLTWFLDDSNLLESFIRQVVREEIIKLTGGQYGISGA